MIKAIFGFLFSIIFAIQALISIFSFRSDSLISILGYGFISFLIALFSWYEIKDNFTKHFILYLYIKWIGKGEILQEHLTANTAESTVVVWNDKLMRWEPAHWCASDFVWNDKLMRWEPTHWSASHLEGKVVTLKAIASIGSKFVRWEGDENSTSEIIKIKMNSQKEVIAIFTEIEMFPLQVDAIGMGMGTITRTPEAYAGRHPKDTVVTLTAKASENGFVAQIE